MSEGRGAMIDKSESSSFEDLTSAAAADEIEEAKLAEAAAEKEKLLESKTDEWQDMLGSGSLLKKVSMTLIHYKLFYVHTLHIWFCINGLQNLFMAMAQYGHLPCGKQWI